MAKKIQKTKSKSKDKESSREDHLIVLVENLHDEIKLVAEGNTMLREEMQTGFKEVNKKIDSMDTRLTSVEIDLGYVKKEVNSIKSEMGSMKSEMQIGFKTLIVESAKHDERFDVKADKVDLLALDCRVTKLESAK